MKKKILISCSIIILTIIIGGVLYKANIKDKKSGTEHINESWYINSQPEITRVDWLNSNKWLAVSWKQPEKTPTTYEKNKSFIKGTSTPIIGLKKIVLTESEWCLFNDSVDSDYSTKWLLDIYALKHNSIEKEKRIDLQKIVKSLNNEYSVKSANSFVNNEEFLLVTVYEKNVSQQNEVFYLHLSDEKLLRASEMDSTILKEIAEENEVPDGYKYLWSSYTNFLDRKIVSENNISTLNKENIGLRIAPKEKSTIPMSNLEKTYPTIEKSVKENNIVVLNYSQVPPSPEEIAKLLVPTDVDPWQDVILYSSGSNDGQEHTITSIDEFLKLYKPD